MGGYEDVDEGNGSRALTADAPALVPPLADYVQRNVIRTPSTRVSLLEQAATFLSESMAEGKSANLIFICTHNSRRSHFAHVWADTAARHFGITGVQCFSGGIETTACDERTVRALRRAGFSVVMSKPGENPVYLVQAFESLPPIRCTSKIYSSGNPGVTEFAAMMCCSDVDDKCPMVLGAALRVPLHYDDPKAADGSPHEGKRYDERCYEIGRDMFQLMSMVDGGRRS